MRSSTVWPMLACASVLGLSACASLGTAGPVLPALIDGPQRLSVVQTAAAPALNRPHPYFIVCGPDCPTRSVLSDWPHTAPTTQASESVSFDSVVVSDSQPDTWSIHFGYASATIAANEADALRLAIDAIARRPVLITGYTDSTVSPTPRISNRQLALDRAVAVKRFLVDAGMPESAITLAAEHLCCYVADNLSEQGRRTNRRAVISIVTRSHP